MNPVLQAHAAKSKGPISLILRWDRAALLALALVGALLASKGFAAVAYTETQSETAIDLVNKLETRHYSKREFDDNLAAELFDAYFRSLDPSHLFLLQSDIDEFEPQKLKLDNEFRAGNLDTGFKIFNRYQQRLEARLEWVVRELPALVEAMDFSVDESLSLEPEKRAWAVDMAEADERWRLQLKNAVLSLKLADKPADELASTLIKRYQNQQHRVHQYNEQDAFQVYANALTELYDPHTNYLSPRTSENFNINMSLSLEGIGAVLQLQDEYTKVSRVIAAGPADKQGELKPSDRIIGVAQGNDEFQDVIGWRLDEVVDLIRGPKGTTVRLQVIPASAKSTDARKVITIVRNKVKLEEQSAQKSIIEIPEGDGVRRVGVIDIPAFYIDFEALRKGDENYKSTTRDVKQLLDELVAEGVEGIIIDLRNNGGGSLQEANDLTGLFIEYGPTVQIRHSSRKVFRDGKRLRSAYYEGPLAVLINRLSASASEIFAGAIQDYQRGVIIGTQSFGKGTVQTLIPLKEGQLKLTESKFYRISGDSTQHRGVIPDIEFPSQYDKEQIGESSLDHALNWDKINPVRHRKYHDIPSLLPVLTDQYQQRIARDPDFIYLEDSLQLAAEARKINTLPLQESARLQLRETQRQKNLDIENKRRVAKGLEPLESLDEDELEESADASTATADPDSAAADEVTADGTEEAVEEDEDILLREAGSILIDALQIDRKAVASNS